MVAASEKVMTKGRPRKSERDDVTAKLDRALVAKAKLIAAHRGVPAAELLSELLRNPLNRAYAQMLAELASSDPPER
jgi:hypothetical protein